jgi:acetyltransferase
MNPRTARRQASRRLGSVRLGPARRVSIRPIDAFDRPGLSAFYAALSTESTRRRFLGGRFVAEAELDDMALGDGIVGVLRESGRDDGAIVAHAQICADGPESAEMAFAVRDDLQGRGIGRSLVAAVVDMARRRGWRRLTAVLYADNVAMRRLLVGAGCQVERDRIDCGIEEIVLRLD